MKTSDFYYDLPEELIAQTPLTDRSASRLLVLDKKTGAVIHKHFTDIYDYLVKGDVLVINNTRVIPARLIGTRSDTGSFVELLLLKRIDEHRWESLVRPGKKVRPGRRMTFIPGELEAVCEEVLPSGNRIIKFEFEGIWEEILDKAGTIPLPPYIHEKLDDPERMHTEWYDFPKEASDIIRAARAEGRRIISVGTTSTRVLETVASNDPEMMPVSGYTNIFIFPGYEFKCIDSLITNFHLPESTLIMLVSALAGRENVLSAYAEAVKERYRFFSFGDAMFITDLKDKEA